MGTSRLSAPTPRPAISRPIITWYHAVTAAIWITKPIDTTTHHIDTDIRRPSRSAMGAAISAPIRVPMESWPCLSLLNQRDTDKTYQSHDQSFSHVVKVPRPVDVLSKTGQEIRHFQESRDLTRIVTKTAVFSQPTRHSPIPLRAKEQGKKLTLNHPSTRESP